MDWDFNLDGCWQPQEGMVIKTYIVINRSNVFRYGMWHTSTSGMWHRRGIWHNGIWYMVYGEFGIRRKMEGKQWVSLGDAGSQAQS